MTGMGKTFIYARMKDGTFPKQIAIGANSVVWLESDITKWMEDKSKNDPKHHPHIERETDA